MRSRKKVLLPNGSTLFEVCCVLSILILISTWSFQFVHLYEPVAVRAELNRLQIVIQYLRRKAVLTQTHYQVHFTDRGYTAEQTRTFPEHVLYGVLPGVQGPPSDPHRDLDHACTYRNKVLEVYPDGTLSAGAIYLTDNKRTYLYALTTDVSSLSVVRCYRYRKSWEIL